MACALGEAWRNSPGVGGTGSDPAAGMLYVAAACLLVVVASAAVPSLPTLTQIPRSDWLNVRGGCGTGPKATGDGNTDDTLALQACFASIGNGSTTWHTIFLPAGRYVITETLVLYKVIGGAIIGVGEETVLVWKGPQGGNSTMIWSDGIARTRLMGFVMDGTAGCSVGVQHQSNESLFETRIRHQNQKFLGFGQAGIRIDNGKYHGFLASAEIIYENNIFDSCGHACKGLPYPPMTATGCGAVAILNFNDCEFSPRLLLCSSDCARLLACSAFYLLMLMPLLLLSPTSCCRCRFHCRLPSATAACCRCHCRCCLLLPVAAAAAAGVVVVVLLLIYIAPCTCHLWQMTTCSMATTFHRTRTAYTPTVWPMPTYGIAASRPPRMPTFGSPALRATPCAALSPAAQRSLLAHPAVSLVSATRP